MDNRGTYREMAASQAEMNGLSIPEDYNPFLAHIGQVYGGMANGADADAIDKVVEAIFTAATDGSRQLRYQPTNDIRPIVTARREGSEAQYIAMMQGFFLPANA